MAITVYWDKQSVRYTFAGLWDWAELEAIHADVFEVIRERDQIISLIFDMCSSVDLPVGALSAMRRMFTYAPPNLGIVIVVTSDDAATMTFSMLGKFDAALGRRIAVCINLQHAHQTVADYYATH